MRCITHTFLPSPYCKVVSYSYLLLIHLLDPYFSQFNLIERTDFSEAVFGSKTICDRVSLVSGETSHFKWSRQDQARGSVVGQCLGLQMIFWFLVSVLVLGGGQEGRRVLVKGAHTLPPAVLSFAAGNKHSAGSCKIAWSLVIFTDRYKMCYHSEGNCI